MSKPSRRTGRGPPRAVTDREKAKNLLPSLSLKRPEEKRCSEEVMLAENEKPKDEVVGAAHQYAEHQMDCKRCSKPGLQLCDKGLALLKKFHDALNGMLNKEHDS